MVFNTKSLLLSLGDHEEVYLVIRQHWVVLARRLLFWGLYLGIIFFLDGLLKSTFPPLESGLAGTFTSLAVTAFAIHAWLGMFLAWAMYYLNVQVITNQRIVDIDQKGLLRHETIELHLHKVEDVTTEIRGVLPNLFGFGNVEVQTAGEKENFVFDSVARPHDIAKIILDLYEKLAPSAPLLPATSKGAPPPTQPHP